MEKGERPQPKRPKLTLEGDQGNSHHESSLGSPCEFPRSPVLYFVRHTDTNNTRKRWYRGVYDTWEAAVAAIMAHLNKSDIADIVQFLPDNDVEWFKTGPGWESDAVQLQVETFLSASFQQISRAGWLRVFQEEWEIHELTVNRPIGTSADETRVDETRVVSP